ncbi:MAG: chromophore lyase CpcT/CpeT [Pseudanabaenaceae cyanobacterium]
MDDTVKQLAECLVGEFTNRAQAIAEPAWYVHLKLWQVPIPAGVVKGYGIFAEQANVLDLSKPYRQRILELQRLGDELIVQYYGLTHPNHWRGAGADIRRLDPLTARDVQYLEGCRLKVRTEAGYFIGEMLPNCQCFFVYNGERRQVELGFKTNGQELISYDKGIDPETGAGIWGALHGGYHFQRLV